jgi:hypothetical protein
MKHAIFVSMLGSIALGVLTGCDEFSLDAYWRSEKYVLIAVDTPGQMNLAFASGNGGAVGLVGPTVFCIGADDRYIVAKQHPATDAFGKFDRSTTNYYIVERTTSPSLAERQKRVQGPLSAAEFERLASNLPLPKFSKTIKDLE